MPETTRRPVNPDYALNQDIVSFANGYPFHIVGQASLDALNQRLRHPISMNRFRPNIVIAGAEPFAEDRWQTIHINTQCFSLVKPCNRCAVTMVDQQMGERAGKEPLHVLIQWCRTPEQRFYEQIRPVVLYGIPRSSNGRKRTVWRKAPCVELQQPLTRMA